MRRTRTEAERGDVDGSRGSGRPSALRPRTSPQAPERDRGAPTPPTVGIALPVFDGERYLREALDALLAQSFGDFELLILDNASTDATPAIAREYTERDERVRYERNSENIGAARNFNRAFALTAGRYFKWAAHDDLLDPTFLARCVDALEQDPGVVLAYPRARIIDEDGKPVLDYAPTFATESPDVGERVASIMTEHKCFQVFGLIRRSALERTNLIGLHAHGDGVLLARLALLGRFVEIPEFLFLPRRHADHSSRMIGDYWSYAAWFDPTLGRSLIFPHWRMFAEYARAILTAPVPVHRRMAAARELARVLGQRWRLLRGDILYHVRPLLVSAGIPERALRRRSST